MNSNTNLVWGDEMSIQLSKACPSNTLVPKGQKELHRKVRVNH